MFGNHKRTLLHKAAEIGDPTICNLLIDHGADVNNQDTRKKTPLWLAAKEGHGDICSMLIQNGAFVDMKCTTGETALWIAGILGHEDTCKILINNGADVCVVNALGFSIHHSIDCNMSKRFYRWHFEYSKMLKLFKLFPK